MTKENKKELYSTAETVEFLQMCTDDLIHFEEKFYKDELIFIEPHAMEFGEYAEYSKNGGIWGYYSPKEWLTEPNLMVRY